jgi:hypothetical protein
VCARGPVWQTGPRARLPGIGPRHRLLWRAAARPAPGGDRRLREDRRTPAPASLEIQPEHPRYQRDVRPRPDPRGRHRRRAPPARPGPPSDRVLVGAATSGGGAATSGGGAATSGGGAGTSVGGAAGPAGRLRAALASAASAQARCSACGLDTSRARIAALIVTFIADTRSLSQAGPWLDNPVPPGQSGAHAGGRHEPDAVAASQLPAAVERADGQRDGFRCPSAACSAARSAPGWACAPPCGSGSPAPG